MVYKMSNIIRGFTPLKIEDFSWNNQNTSTAYNVCNSINMHGVCKNSTDSISSLLKTAPTKPYSCTINFGDYSVYVGGGWWYKVGMVIRNSTSGKLIHFSFSASDYTNCRIAITTYSDSNTYVGQIYDSGAAYINKENIWLRLVNNNTNRIYYFSIDGINWSQLYSEANNTYFEENQIGIGINPWQNNTYTKFRHFKFDYTG
jgi:hypothetical protein